MKAAEKKESVRQASERILDNYLEMNNYRKTPERYAILKAVYDIDGHFTLEELGQKLADDQHFPVSRATLYNTLNLFIELRIVIRHNIQGTTKYEAYYPGDNHCHQICTMCGKVTEVKAPEVTKAIAAMRLKRFRQDVFSLYIYGVCSSCQSVITRKSNKHKTTDNDKNDEQRKG
ncbi:MAG: transcriptional repressor [Prevotella sp.]|jgi:Fur family ferric uptake transcriptional regulator|nr:transcriptional repressor [Prevotella sp.]